MYYVYIYCTFKFIEVVWVRFMFGHQEGSTYK